MSDSPGRSLHDLEGDEQADVETSSVHATTCRVHRRTPIGQLGTEALRFLLEEGKSTDVLLRVAVDRLERDPFQGGDFYPGDLLATVLGLPVSIWISVPDLRAQVYALVEDAGDLLDLLEPEDRAIVERAIGRFKSRWMNGGMGMGG
jgi:CDI immunity proteins